jgi:hypothetical protein
METEKLCDGLELTASEDMEYIVVYRNKKSNGGGVAFSANGMDLMALTTANVINTLETMNNNPYLQAVFFATMFDMVKSENALSPLVDLAVSYDGIVLRKEKTADYCE